MAYAEILCPERDDLFKRYARLRQECDQLKYQIANSYITNTDTLYCRTSPSAYSTFSSPTSPNSNTFPSWPDSPAYSPSTTPARQSQSSTNEHTLLDLNGQIVATLTELLNCDSIKHDMALRSWVQERLMEAEHDCRKQRRRRKSGASREAAAAAMTNGRAGEWAAIGRSRLAPVA